ncbi:MAG: 1-deoxy-D-xylulose-5-phosphate synthase [Flavobacteriales bacterium]
MHKAIVGKILSGINSPEDLRKLEEVTLDTVCSEIRALMIDVVSENGGHFSAGLGAVELTVGIHYVFNTPEDTLVWDVGHQSYPHKILTERRDSFHTLRKKDGISGFPNPKESKYDDFIAGHSSTSISAATGMAVANKIQGKNNLNIAVIGDGGLTAGQAFESLNHAAVSGGNILIIVNDNNQSIDSNVGAFQVHLQSIRKGKEPNFFKEMGFDFYGPINGNNLSELLPVLKKIKNAPASPKILYCHTIKGKGYLPAETGDKVFWHAPGVFNKATGKVELFPTQEAPPKFQDVFGKTLLELADRNEKIVAVTPAMPSGSSLNFLQEKYPNKVFDVGIAEQHAVTFSAGMAKEGLTVFCCIYSTFLQRGYDQLIHDVCLQKLPVIFCIDRAGLVGNDGATHQGAFDIAYLRIIPNIILCAPIDEIELRNTLYSATLWDKTIAIRYPRGIGFHKDWQNALTKVDISANWIEKGSKIAVISYGTVGMNVKKASAKLKLKNIHFSHLDLRFVKPLDDKKLHEVFQNHELVLVVEDGVIVGGAGSAVLEWASERTYTNRIYTLGIPDEFIEHATQEEQKEKCGYSVNGIIEKILSII